MTAQRPSNTYTITCGVPPTVQVYEFEVGVRRVLLPDHSWAELTSKQYDIFLLMVKGSLNQTRGRLFGRRLIQEQVWRDKKPYEDMTNAIEKHISGIRATGIRFIRSNYKEAYYLDASVQLKEEMREEVPSRAASAEEMLSVEVLQREVLPEEEKGTPKPVLDPELTFYSMVVAVLLTAAITTSLTAVIRAVFTQAQQTITQAPHFGWVLGLLQGVAGALIWSIPLAVVFLRRWFRAGETYGTWSRGLELRWASLRMLSTACVVGFAGGLAVDMLVMFAQQPISLEQAHWMTEQDGKLPSPWTIFTVSHLGWAEPALGVVTCFGCVATLLILLRRPRWKAMIEEHHRQRTVREMVKLLAVVLFRFGLWPLAITVAPVVAGSVLLFFIFNQQLTLGRFVGEGVILGGAGFSFVLGTLFALLFEAQGARATYADGFTSAGKMDYASVPLLGSQPRAVLDLLQARKQANGSRQSDGRKLGLVVEGGGMRGVLSAGSLLALDLGGYRGCFDTVFAVSAGSVNAAYFLSGQGMTGISVYFDDISSRRFFYPLRFWKMADVDYVYDHVVAKLKPLDEEALRRSPQEFFLTATEVDSGELALLNIKDPDVAVVCALKASSALPILYNRSVEIKHVRYMDGGIAGGLPVELAVKHGCTDLLIILSRPCIANPKPPGFLERCLFRVVLGFRHPLLYRSYLASFADKQRNRALATGQATLDDVNMACICPDAAGNDVRRTTTDRAKLVEGAFRCANTAATIFGIHPSEVTAAFDSFLRI